MSWTLVLMFLLSGQEPEYISVEAETGIACVDQAKLIKTAFDADPKMGGVLKWFCTSQDGAIITSDDEDKGE